jgi:hypothetical protein
MLHRGLVATGQHLDSSIHEIARETPEPETAGLAYASGAVKHTLNPAGNK